MRTQLRPFHTDETLGLVYSTMYDHTRWSEHIVRVAHTIEIATAFGKDKHWVDGIDLSCGDGAILTALKNNDTIQTTYFGDFAFAQHLNVVGRIEDTMPATTSAHKYDLLVLSETIEHLIDPDQTLRDARALASHLVLSTPIGETTEVGNPEHYWGWDVDDIQQMLMNAGWSHVSVNVLPCPWYTYQIWTCS